MGELVKPSFQRSPERNCYDPWEKHFESNPLVLQVSEQLVFREKQLIPVVSDVYQCNHTDSMVEYCQRGINTSVGMLGT